MAGDIAQGGINAVGGLFRAVTSIGRASVNLANDVIPYANDIYDLTSDGLTQDEVGAYLSSIWNGTWAGLGGAAKGLAMSFMPPTEQSAQDLQKLFGGEKPVEGAYEMFQTQGFIEASKNLPFLQEMRSEEKVGVTPGWAVPFDIPFLGIKAGVGMDITKAGLYSFGFDVFTDPFSFMTLGVGGALKGGAKAVGTVSTAATLKKTAAKEGRKVSVEDIESVAPPTLYPSAPAREISYHVTDTNPLLYIGKEMGRGFMDAHRATAARIRARSEIRAAKKVMSQEVARTISRKAAEGETFNLGEIIQEAKDATIAKLQKQVSESNVKLSDTEIAERVGIQKARLEQLVPELIAKAEAKGLSRLDDLKARADAEGVSVKARIEADLMDDAARKFAGTSPAIRRTQTTKYDATEVETLGDNFRQAAKAGDQADIASAWDAFRETADDYTIQQALKRLLGQIGSHEKGGKQKIAAGKATFEEREMMKRLSGLLKEEKGAGSERLSQQGKLPVVDKKALAGFSTALRKALVGAGDTEKAVQQLIAAAPDLDGKTLQAALTKVAGGIRIAGERLQYMGLTGQVKTTPEYEFIKSLRDKKYNPKTTELGSTSLNDFTVVKGEGRVTEGALSRVTKLSMQATGKWYPPRLGELLRKAGIKDSDLFDGDAHTNVANFIEIALWRKIEAKSAAARAEIFKAKYGQYQLNELLAEAPAEIADVHIREISNRARIYGRDSLKLTDSEIEEMIGLAADIKDAQISAIQELSRLGLDPFSQAGAIRTTFLGSREIGAKMQAEAQTRTGFAPTKELEELKQVKKTVNFVKEISKGEKPITDAAALAKEFEQEFFKAIPKPQASKEIIALGRELRDIIKDSEGLTNQRIRQLLFSRLQSVIVRFEGESSRSSVAGFDFAFTDVNGRYVRSAVANGLGFLYAGSAAKNSLDGGYFQRYVDEVLLAGRDDIPGGQLINVTSVEKRAEILSSVANNWGGEGITFGLLQDALQAAKGGRAAADRLTPAEKKEFNKLITRMWDRFADDAIENLRETSIDRILFEEGMEYRTDWINRLSDAEQKIARQTLANKVFEIDPKLAEDANFKTNKLAYRNVAQFLPNGKEFARTKNNGALRAIADEVAASANRAAREAVETERARVLFNELLPWWASSEEVAKLARAYSVPRAQGAAQMTLMMANMLVRTEAAAKVADRSAAIANKLGDKTREQLAGEAKFFDSIARNLETKFAKEGYKPPTENLSGKRFEEIVGMENPIAFLRWVRDIRTGDVQGQADWVDAMAHMLSLETIGKGSAFRTAKELFESYKGNLDGVERKATAQEVVETIAALGGDVETGKLASSYLRRKDGLPQRRTILKLIDKAEPILEKSEIARASGNNWMREVNLVGKETVEAEVAQLPDIAMTAEKAQEKLAMTLAELEATNKGWIATLAMQAVGDSMRQFFVHRTNFFVKSARDKLGRVIDEYQLPGAKSPGYLKKSWEDLTNYTGFKSAVDTVRQMAPTAKRGKLTEDEWVAKTTRQIMSVRDLYLLSRGIVPVHTLNLKRGEALPNQLANALSKQADDIELTAVALTENDIMDLLPDQDVVDLFFSSANGSPRFNMPPTAVMPAARMLVAAMDSLPEGQYFNEEQLSTLGRLMIDAMKLDASKSSVSQGKKFSWVNLDPERAVRSIGILVERLLDPDVAFRLFEKHLANSIYAHGILRYQAGQLAEPIMDAWTRVATNPIASSSDRMQATIDAMAELNKLLGIDDQSSELARVMAVLDSQARLAMEIDVDSLIDIQVANKISKAGFVPSEEGQRISKLQAGLRKKATQNEVTGHLAEAMVAREPLLSDMYVQKIAQLEGAGYRPTPDEQHLLFNDIITDQAKIPWYLSFLNTGLRLFSFDYQKQNVAPYLTGFALKTIEDQAEYTNMAVNYALKWQRTTEQTGTNYAELAFAKLQQIADEDLPKVALASDTILKLTSRTMRGTVSKKELRGLKAAMDDIEYFKQVKDKDGNLLFPDDDPLLVEAVADLWRFGGHFFGPMGKIARSGHPGEWINLQLQAIGSAEVRGAFREIDGQVQFIKQQDAVGFGKEVTNPQELAQSWREWEISNPYLMMSTLNSALARGDKVIQEAAYLQKLHGVKNPSKEVIKEKNLVRIKGPDSMRKQGQELLYFIDTENYWFQADIAAQLIRTSKDLYAPYRVLEDVRKFASKFDELQNFAKRSMTLFRFGNFVMNYLGGFWTNLLGGVGSPVMYYRSLIALRSLYPDLKELPFELGKMEEQVVRYHAKRAQEGYTVRPENNPLTNGQSQVVTVNGKANNYKLSELAQLYRILGGEVSVASSRNIDLLKDFGSAESMEKLTGKQFYRPLQRVYEKMSLKIGRLAALRDDHLRMAMFLDELGKGNWKSLEEGARVALRKVNRYHPQVPDLSKFNSEVTRQFILFFVWQAKTLGWIVNDILDRPGAIMTVARAQQAYQTSQGQEPEYFGSFDPKGEFLRDWQQGQMQYLTGNLQYSFSYANPVNDLLGSNGWLSKINYKTYESPATNAMTSSLGSINNFLYSSNPIFANMVISWAAGRTVQGTDLLRNGSFNEDSLAILSEEIAGQLGLTLPHAALALAFPEQISRRNWDDETALTEKQKDTLRYLFNWMTGMRSQEFLGYEQRQKALSELKSTLRRIRESEVR